MAKEEKKKKKWVFWVGLIVTTILFFGIGWNIGFDEGFESGFTYEENNNEAYFNSGVNWTIAWAIDNCERYLCEETKINCSNQIEKTASELQCLDIVGGNNNG